jgi:protein-S-isoprenylcysteine O-methyltransferase Ste14
LRVRTIAKHRRDGRRLSPWAGTLLHAVLVAGASAVAFPWLLREAGLDSRRLGIGVFRVAGLLPLVVGSALYVAAAKSFVSAGGTPSPFRPPGRLVRGGVYGGTRNPLYFSFLLIVLGESLLLDSVALAAWLVFLAAGLHLRVTLYEEPGLRQSFGAAWDAYRKAVPRWLPAIRKPRNYARIR